MVGLKKSVELNGEHVTVVADEGQGEACFCELATKCSSSLL